MAVAFNTMSFLLASVLAIGVIFPVAASETGLAGYPAKPYDPICATACLRSLYALTLDCSSKGVTVGMVDFTTSTECYAQNTPYLTSLAWCAHTKCSDKQVLNSTMEYFWEQQVTGQQAAGVKTVPAKWSYAEALHQVDEAPTLQLGATDAVLNETSLVPPTVYIEQYNVLYGVQQEETIENAYGIAILVTGFGLPIVLTYLGFLPPLAGVFSKLKPYLIWPSTIGTYHVRPLPYFLGNVPTAGQTLYIATFFILNVILTAVGYESHQPNAWYPTRWRETVAHVFTRTGNFAYIMAPLVFLFAGRNNILLWLTNWSHSTYMLLHRWVARIFTLQALLHSILALVLYCEDGNYAAEHSKPYWIWGIAATLCAVVLTFASNLYIRRLFYESFLIAHIVLSVILVVGCWYHAYDLYLFLGGFEDWLYAVAAVWAFDRFARLVRMVIVGPRCATVTEIGDGASYVRVDIPGIRWSLDPGKHAYLYFPTLHPLRPWENHPFSVLPTALLPPPRRQKLQDSSDSESSLGDSWRNAARSDVDVEKRGAAMSQVEASPSGGASIGLTVFVRKSEGATRRLSARTDLLAFAEGPYPNNSSAQVLQCDRLLLLGGGIGITALVPFLANHWNVKLCWSVKESARCLVDELEGVLDYVVEKTVLVGQRLDVGTLLAEEVKQGWEKVGVVVSGPGRLCDDVRALVTATARNCTKTAFELEVEAYSW